MGKNRGAFLLILGIVSVFLFPPLGIVVWVAADRDLQKMKIVKTESPSREFIETAKGLGIITFTVVLQILVFVISWLVANWGVRAGEL